MSDKIKAIIIVDAFARSSSSNTALENRREFIEELNSHQLKPVDIRFQKIDVPDSDFTRHIEYYCAIIEYEIEESNKFNAQVKLNQVIKEKIEPFLKKWGLTLRNFYIKDND